MSGSDDLDKGDLPRIVVGGDSIVVLDDSDNDWVERDVEDGERGFDDDELGEDLDDLKVEDVERFLDEGVYQELSVGGLEEDVGGFVEKRDLGEFYDEGGKGVYDARVYEEGSIEYSVEAKVGFVDFDERGKKSTLEMMGFEDVEMRKKREKEELERLGGY